MNLLAISAAIWVTVMASCVAALLILSRWHGRPAAMVEDPTPFEDEADPPDCGHLTPSGLALIAAATGGGPRSPEMTVEYEPDDIDPPAVPAYLADDLVQFYGVAVHKRCLVPYLRTGARPCGGCAEHLDSVLTGAA